MRDAAADVAAQADYVRIDPAGLRRLAESVAREAEVETNDPAHRPFDDPATTLAYVITLDAVNFGSGWFPVLDKIPGRSGYFTISTRLREHFERQGAWSIAALVRLRSQDCAAVFGQDPANAAACELMDLFARSLSDLGRLLAASGMRGYSDLVDAASGSAERLVGLLASAPFYRDVSDYHGRDVPLYKRAQITAADLALAFDGHGPGRFEDLDDLTMFADNLVPHVLRCEGVLHYDADLLARIERGELLPAGSPEEVEIRAVALHAVEQVVDLLASDGAAAPLPARRVDQLLWNRGQHPAIKRFARHRTRTVYY